MTPANAQNTIKIVDVLLAFNEYEKEYRNGGRERHWASGLSLTV